MIKFSMRSVSVVFSAISVLSEPTQRPGGLGLTSLFIVAPGPSLLRAGGGRLRLAHADRLRTLPALLLPAVHRLAQLEEGDDARRDRQPEGDHAVGQHRGEHLGAGDAEE